MQKCECHGRIFDTQESVDNHMALESGELTDRAVIGILDAIRKGKQPLGAARQAGVDPKTWAKNLKGNPILQEAVELAEIEAAEAVAEVLYDDAINGRDYKSKELWLKHKGGTSWKPDAQKVEISVIETVKALPLADRLEKLAELLASRPDIKELEEPIDAEVLSEL